MDSVARKPGIGDFKPQVGSKAPPRKWFGVSRTVIIAMVIGAHVVVAGLLAFPVLQKVISEPGPGEEEGPPVAMVDMLIAEQNPEADKVAEGSKNRPPVLKPVRGESPVERARRAGVPVAAAARTLLLVRVSEEGKATDVTVAESSGADQLDNIAVEYARTLEWDPALVDGRAAIMSIRLPVEFKADG